VPDEPVRLSKVVAARVPCSRREAEQYIAEGWVRVDGQVVREPQFRVADERVDIDPQADLAPPMPATFLLHKPAGVDTAGGLALLVAAQRWADDPSGVRPLRSHSVRLVPLLELPPSAEGLCVFSQDGRVVRKLREDAGLIEQELVAHVAGTVAPDGLQRLSGGLVHRGRRLPPVRVSWQSEARLRFALKGIEPEVVPWMCAEVGLEVTVLRRLRIGRVALARLPVGQWRYLAAHERF